MYSRISLDFSGRKFREPSHAANIQNAKHVWNIEGNELLPEGFKVRKFRNSALHEKNMKDSHPLLKQWTHLHDLLFLYTNTTEIILLQEMEKQKQEREHSRSTEIKQNVLFYSK